MTKRSLLMIPALFIAAAVQARPAQTAHADIINSKGEKIGTGTRFYASLEAAGAQAAKERIREVTGDDTLRSIVFDISRRNVWPAPFTGRCLRNAHADRWFGREIELMRHLDQEAEKYAAARAAGDFDIAAVIAGEAAGLIHDIPSASDVIQRVVGEASALLARWSSQAT
jgi:nitronate monooxygenase